MDPIFFGSSSSGSIIGAESTASSLDESLFTERLLFFYEQSLGEVRAFAQREWRSYEEVRKILLTTYSCLTSCDLLADQETSGAAALSVVVQGWQH